MTTTPDPEKWLPINFRLSQTEVRVRWMDFGSAAIFEPFFFQTVRRLRAGDPPAKERDTGLTALLDLARELPRVQPSGVIFHVSRCGSTLVANALRTDPRSIVICESAPFGLFFRPARIDESPFPMEGRDQARRLILNALATVYGNFAGANTRLVIKCHAINLLQISWIRSLWPATPFLIVIRDPLEVMISQFGKPAGWVKCRDNPSAVRTIFGWREDAVRAMSLEEYGARGLKCFFETALAAVDEQCRIIDYRNLDAVRLQSVARFLGAPTAPPDSGAFKAALSAYSKDPAGVRLFEDDSPKKQGEATEILREAVSKWAWEPYQLLKANDTW